MTNVQKKSYGWGSIWNFLNEEETNILKSFYDILIKFKDNPECATYLYSTQDKTHPKSTQSGYYDKETSDEIHEYILSLNDTSKLPHQKNKMIHTHLDMFCKKYELPTDYFEKYILLLNSLASRIVKHEYNIITNDEQTNEGQLSWYTDGDFITFHNDGPSGDRLCALLIYLTPADFYKVGNGGELVLKDDREVVDLVYPTLGTYALIDFSKNNPYHGVHKVIGDFNRFTYLNFIKKPNI
jgi:Rps23 Pro-64 3,4-dihydroxylase Tpa1-like proline 4-hydroxylase